MVPQKVNGTKLKQALDKFKSLESALEEMLKEKSTLEKDNARLKKENEQSELTRDKLSLEVNETNRKLNELKKQLDLLAKTADEYERRYKLFEGFLSMMATSPSVTNSIESAIASLQEILNSGWRSSAKPDELRTLFVRTTMGDYLKCFRCDSCGAKFIVNKEQFLRQEIITRLIIYCGSG
jgi:chromosome segregation ATPase